MVKDFHHFKGDHLSRSEKIQRKVTEMILESDVTDEMRENSQVWEIKHHAGTVQIGRTLALRRSLDIELAEIICVLHDIYAIVTGKYKDHARKGAEIAKQMLKETGDFSTKEIVIITEAIAGHSDKHIYTDKPYVELAKDADAFECSLYENARGYYTLHKPKKVYEQYIKRMKKVRKELGLPVEKVFRD